MTKAERQKLLEEKIITMQTYERDLREKGITYIGGVDEVGRGPLAGPVTAAAGRLRCAGRRRLQKAFRKKAGRAL